MKSRYLKLILLYTLHLTLSDAKILRNNALMQKMITHFQKDNPAPTEVKVEQGEQGTGNSEKLLTVMQNVLCRNFPTIPCNIIIEDNTLKKLIERSINQINMKKANMEQAPHPTDITVFPTINSEDLSNFLQVRDMGYYNKKHSANEIVPQTWSKTQQKRNEAPKPKKYMSNERRTKNMKKNKRKDFKRTTVYNGRKKIRKFYPHKIKYKDKSNNNKELIEYSDEKMSSMSLEIPDIAVGKKHQRLNYKREPADPPVWRIDYMKHGEPSLNMFGYQKDQLKDKITKLGPGMMVDEHMLHQAARKDVMHPDVYIKKNFPRKNTFDLNSEGAD